MTMLGFGSKTATKYVPDMKGLILEEIKCQTMREWSEHWAKLTPGDTLQLYWKPRVKKQWKRIPNPPPSLANWRNILHAGDNIEHNETLYHPPDGHFKLITLWDTTEERWFKQVGGCEFLGKAEVTELFTIELWKDGGLRLMYGSAYHNSPSKIIEKGGGIEEILEDLAFRDGFRDGEHYDSDLSLLNQLCDIYGEKRPPHTPLSGVEKMFKFFDETYGLEEPKQFVVIRWK